VVRLEKDITLEEDLVVPAKVTLLLPCVEEDTGYQTYVIRKFEGGTEGTIDFNYAGVGTAGKKGHGPNAFIYRELTIPEGIIMTVKGTVLVNSVSGREGTSGYEQDVTGGYAQINLDGRIEIERGGILENFGYVKGEGLMKANLGATVGDLFLVRNWRGGSQALRMYPQAVYPMNQYDCCNIQCELQIHYGAVLNGLVKMYADGDYHCTRFPQVAATNAMFELSRGAYAVRTVENGREVYHVYGGAKYAGSSLRIVGEDVSSKAFLYPIDGDMDYILHDGDYSFVNDHKIMPGATILVKKDATLTIADGVKTVFYDCFDDSAFLADGSAYPERDPAILTLESTAQFTNNGTFAGTIYTSGANVFYGGAKTPADSSPWQITTKEANGFNGRPSTNQLNFTLEIIRPDHEWRYGLESLGEKAYSIVWNGGESSFTVSATGEKTSVGASVTVEMRNTKPEDVVCTLMVAAYDANDRMLAADVQYGCTVGTNALKSVNLELSTTETIAKVILFLLDGNSAPMADEMTVPVQK